MSSALQTTVDSIKRKVFFKRVKELDSGLKADKNDQYENCLLHKVFRFQFLWTAKWQVVSSTLQTTVDSI